MDSLLKADIFFFISSIGIIILFIILIVALWFAIRFLRHAEYIAKKIRHESDNISNDLAEIRADIKEKVFESKLGIGSLLGAVGGFFGGFSKKKKKATKAKHARNGKIVDNEDEAGE